MGDMAYHMQYVLNFYHWKYDLCAYVLNIGPIGM